MELFSLKNKTILVTGGYGHLGKAMCTGLLEANANVFVLGTSQEKFDAAFAHQKNIHFEKCDISDSKSIKKCFDAVYEKTKQIDGLINNAVYLKGQNPETMSDEDWSYGVDGTLNSVYRCIREVIPFMKKQGSGKIINVSSMYGVVSPDFEIYKDNDFLNPPHYGAAKAGVIQLTKYYASYLGKFGINVNTITPGPFPSNEVQKNKTFINNLEDKTLLGRIGKPDDLKGLAVFLCSDSSSFITGQNIIIDGGWTTK